MGIGRKLKEMIGKERHREIGPRRIEGKG